MGKKKPTSLTKIQGIWGMGKKLRFISGQNSGKQKVTWQ